MSKIEKAEFSQDESTAQMVELCLDSRHTQFQVDGVRYRVSMTGDVYWFCDVNGLKIGPNYYAAIESSGYGCWSLDYACMLPQWIHEAAKLWIKSGFNASISIYEYLTAMNTDV